MCIAAFQLLDVWDGTTVETEFGRIPLVEVDGGRKSNADDDGIGRNVESGITRTHIFSVDGERFDGGIDWRNDFIPFAAKHKQDYQKQPNYFLHDTVLNNWGQPEGQPQK